MIYMLLRICLYPFLWLGQLFIPKLKERYVFEKKNNQVGSKSFLLSNQKADFCFHVSSEGEFEQIGPIIEALIEDGYKLEILFTSPSVEHRILQLQTQNPEQIRILRLRLISYNPLDIQTDLRYWVSANVFFMVRYDFFPELIRLGKRSRSFILLNASLKNKSLTGLKGIFFKRVLKQFTHIISANQKEDISFKAWGLKTEGSYDFRIIQILKRVSQARETLVKKDTGFIHFEDFLNSFPIEKRFIYGSLWASEVSLIKFDKENLHIIVPHKLNQTSLDSIQRGSSVKTVEVNLKSDFKKLKEDYSKEPFVMILNEKGILCELYSFFSKAYVGGGFGVSIHSVLEPYLAGCIVFCGPINHRSTEIDFIKHADDNRLVICEEKIDLSESIQNEKVLDSKDYKNEFNNYMSFFKGLRNE